jgi:hypothetical protein
MHPYFRKCMLVFLFSVTVPIYADVDYSSMSLEELEVININNLEKKEQKAFTKARDKARKQAKKDRKAKRKAQAKADKERRKQQELEALQNVPVCFTEYNCEKKWAAARDWVNNNAKYKIQIYSDDLIETYKGSNTSADLYARVTKTLLGGVGDSKVYAIELSAGCANIFGCFPNAKKSLLNFNQVVGAANSSDPNCYKDLVSNMKSTPPIGVYALESNNKVRIKQVCVGTPAHEAGIEVNDIITSIDDVEVISQEDLMGRLAKTQAGDVIKIGLIGKYGSTHLELLIPELSEADGLIGYGQLQKTTKGRLSELKQLFDSGFVTKEEYSEKRKEIIDAL